MDKIKQRLQELSELIADLDALQYVKSDPKSAYIEYTEGRVRTRYSEEVRDLEDLLNAISVYQVQK